MPPRMIPGLAPGMAEAAALTRSGNLAGATARIQQMLTGAQPAAPDVVEPFIEGTYRVIDPPGDAPRPEAKPARRAPLAETLRQIARGNMTVQGKPSAARSHDPRFTHHTCSGPAGARDYMLYLPQMRSTVPLPVVMMLHGCTQSPQDFATGTRMNALAEAQGWIVVYPAQPSGANANKCWNWFRPGDQSRGAGEPAILAAIAQEVTTQHRADPRRLFAAGLSAGGAAAAVLGQAYPDLFAAIGVHSGLAAGSASDVASAFAAMRSGASGGLAGRAVPTIVFHGTADGTVDVANARAVAAQAQKGLQGPRVVSRGTSGKGRTYEVTAVTSPDGRSQGEVWLIDGAGHAWSGGDAAGSYTDSTGPDASTEMLRFFAQHSQRSSA